MVPCSKDLKKYALCKDFDIKTLENHGKNNDCLTKKKIKMTHPNTSSSYYTVAFGGKLNQGHYHTQE